MNLAIAVGYSQRKVPFWTLLPSFFISGAQHWPTPAYSGFLGGGGGVGWGCDQPLKEPQQTGMFKCECNSTINSKSGLGNKGDRVLQIDGMPIFRSRKC